MSETVGQFLSYTNVFLPHNLASTDVLKIMNDEIIKYWPRVTDVAVYDFATVTDQPLYVLPTNVKMNMLVKNALSIADTTTTVSSTTVFNEYKYAGPEEELEGSIYYDALGRLGVFPVPDNSYPARLRYVDYPDTYASSDTSRTITLDDDFLEFIRNTVLSRIAKSGKYARVDLANNYYADAKEISKKTKLREAQDKVKNAPFKWGWQDWG